VLTGEGEQLLNDCRGLLSYASGLDERAQMLRRGDTGVLKVAASPQFIEGGVSGFLHRYAERFPNVQVKLIEAIGWSDVRGMLERGEVHLGQNLAHAVQLGDQHFGSHPLEFVEQLAACHRSLPFGNGAAVEIGHLAPYPLLLLDGGYIFRRTFDAACRLAGLEPNIAFESRTPHTLLAMAESGNGIAIIPSTLRADRYRLRIVGLTFQGKPLREPLAMFWDKRRPLPRYATAFCNLLGAYVREIFPVTRPTEFTTASGSKRSVRRRVR
jgi:DNA-binding transcriptional LysR family regulator